jgi:hypothetical protein
MSITDTALNPEETMVGQANGPGIWIAPAGTAPPADLDTDFAAPWKSLGYASDDGVTLSGDTTEESLTPWQSRSPIRTIITEKSVTVQFVMWQLNQDTLSLYFNEDVPDADADGVYEFDVRSDSSTLFWAVGIDIKDGDNSWRRIFPRAALSTTGDQALTKGAMVPLDVTLSALDDGGVLTKHWVKAGGTGGGSPFQP